MAAAGGARVPLRASTTEFGGWMANATTMETPTRRDFLYLATGAVGAVGVAAVAWPFIDQMNPDASTLAMSSIEVDLGAIPEGQIVTVNWRGGPVFVRHRTKKEIEEAQNVRLSETRSSATRE
jgi:ubiquinol-cytochrome c reductase iron-sulfur subunit